MRTVIDEISDALAELKERSTPSARIRRIEGGPMFIGQLLDRIPVMDQPTDISNGRFVGHYDGIPVELRMDLKPDEYALVIAAPRST